MAATREINYSDTLSKLALMVQGMAISLCIAKTLRFSGGIVAHLLKYHQSDLLTRLRFAWYPLAVGLPLFAVVLAALGYYYSALEVRNLIRMTALLLMSVMILNHLALRRLTLARRKIALKEARQKRQLEFFWRLIPSGCSGQNCNGSSPHWVRVSGSGLQEIVANFICGLIVLFKRAFRVGDTVTTGIPWCTD